VSIEGARGPSPSLVRLRPFECVEDRADEAGQKAAALSVTGVSMSN